MREKSTLKPLVAAIGSTIATSLTAVPAANADQNPCGLTELSSGYMVAGAEGKCGEVKCGGSKANSAED